MYLVFAWSIASGGFNDYRTHTDTIKEAQDYIEQANVDCGHIVFIGKETFVTICSYDKSRCNQWTIHTPNLYITD
jgi:hypothetical protein